MTIGVWVLATQRYCRENGGPAGVAKLMAQHGIAYVVPKTHSAYFHKRLRDGWYPDCPQELFEELTTSLHARNIKSYAWAYVYGGAASVQDIANVRQGLASSADGVVLNAEAEYCHDANRYGDAEQLCADARRLRDDQFQGKLLVYSTFARSWKGIGQRFPYRVFGQYLDQFWPQTYWRTFRQQPDVCVREVDSHLRAKYTKWQSRPEWAVGIKPIVHTGHAYAKTVPATELRTFLATLQSLGYREANLYIADRFSKEQWKVIDEFTGGDARNKSVAGAGFFGWLGAAFTWLLGTLWWLVIKAIELYIIGVLLRCVYLLVDEYRQLRRGTFRATRTPLWQEVLVTSLWWPVDLLNRIRHRT